MNGSTLLRLLLFVLLPATLACSGGEATADPVAPAASEDSGTGQSPPAGETGESSQAGNDAAPETAAQQVPLVSMEGNPAEIKATVNGVPISRRELDIATVLYAQSQGLPDKLNQEQVDEVRRVVMEGLIDRELLYQRSVKDGITPDPAAVEQMVTQARESFPTEEAWLANLKAQGVRSHDAYKNLVVRSMAIEKMVEKSVGKTAVTDADVKKYYDENPDQMQTPEQVRASHILFRYPEGKAPGAMEAQKAKAEDVLKRLKAGEDFATLASQHSDDHNSGVNGGDLGLFGRGRMVPEFEEVAFSLEPGQISEIFETQFGWHIMKLVEKQPARLASFEEVQNNLRNFLSQKTARDKLNSVISELRGDAQIRRF